MTLSPVFRSEESRRFLEEQGYLKRFKRALEVQKRARDSLTYLVYSHFNKEYHGAIETEDDMKIFEQDFFLILFNEICKVVGSKPEKLEWYAKFNYCIRSRVTLADNIFDNEEKTTLPFSSEIKGEMRTILEFMATEELFRTLGRLEEVRYYYDLIKRKLDNKMIAIGKLEGSEEKGIRKILTPESMIPKVHRVRGGALFELSMIAPKFLEPEKGEKWIKAEMALNDIGTAFQIVDDITDFEFDLKRGSNNIVTAEAYHNGTDQEKQMLEGYLQTKNSDEKALEKYFSQSATRVVQTAYQIARKGFEKLQNLGFWYSPEHAEQFVNAILGNVGTPRLEGILEEK
ncbi:MAG: class 1 isoprenoid biosynthesis enzyme [Nanoarchaeota archaeon]